jgi:signal transduction histidine kinase/HAMP domain-containing protein
MKERLARRGEKLFRRFWGDVGLQAKMTLLVVMGLIALVGIFGFLGVGAVRESTDRTLQERVVLAELIAAHMDQALENVEGTLVGTAGHEALIRDDVSLEAKRASLREAYQPLSVFSRRLFLADASGRLLLIEPPAPGFTDSARASLPSVAESLQTGRFALAPAVSPPGSSGSSIIASVPLRNRAGTIVGALAADIDPQSPQLSAFLQPFFLGKTGLIDVVDAQGIVIISTRPERQATPSDHNGVLASFIKERRKTVATCHNCHHPGPSEERRTEVLAFASMTHAPWGVVVRQGEDEAFAAARHLQQRIALFGGVAILGALFLVYLTTRSVIVPVQLLTAAAERIALGDLATPVPSSGSDEIGVLARAFDDMRSRLKASIEEVRWWNRELESRVQERTEECQASRAEAQQARDYLQTIIDGLSDELIVVDRDRRVRKANAIVRQRWPGKGSLVGQPCYQVTHHDGPCQPPDCECPMLAVLASGRPARATHYHSNGQGLGRHVEIVASPLWDERGQVREVIELRRDVTEEKSLKEAILRRNRELATMNELAMTITQSLRLETILGKALDDLLPLTGMDVGSIYLVEKETGQLKLQAYRGVSQEAAQAMLRLHRMDSGCGGVVETGQPQVVPDLAGYYGGRTGASLEHDGLRSLVHVPLTVRGAPLGSLCVGTRNPHDFVPEEVALLTAIGSHIAVAVENARLYEEVKRKEELRGELLEKVIAAQEEERKRIARELHDDTSQALTALLYAIETATETSDPTEARRVLAGMRQVATATLEGVHKLIFDLRPAILDNLGLPAALRWYAETRLQEAGVRLHLEEKGTSRRLPPQTETALFRVVQEAISNIVRHAGARNVRLIFDCQDSAVGIDVQDDGIGFDMAEVARSIDQQRGLGLVGMQERVSLLGGQIAIVSAPGMGTQISIRVPLEARNA